MSNAKARRRLSAISGLALGMGVFTGSALATSNTPMEFRTFEPCRGSGSFCGTRILASGVIEITSDKKLAAFIARAPKNSIPSHTTIVFDSPGGSVSGGVALGRFIRSRGYDTALERDVDEEIPGNGPNDESIMRSVANNTMCASACALAFLGGNSRSMAPDARYGVHQFYAASGNIGDSAAQLTMTALAFYVEEMGVDRRLLDFATSAGPSSMRWLDERLARELRIDNTRPLLAEWRINADKNGLPSLSVHQSVAPNRELILSMQNGGRGVIVTVIAVIAKDAQGVDRRTLFPVAEPLRVQFISESNAIAKALPVSPWRKVLTNPDGSVAYGGSATITLDELKRISNTSTLRFDDDFPSALSDLSMASELSVEGLRNGSNLLMRAR